MAMELFKKSISSPAQLPEYYALTMQTAEFLMELRCWDIAVGIWHACAGGNGPKCWAKGTIHYKLELVSHSAFQADAVQPHPNN